MRLRKALCGLVVAVAAATFAAQDAHAYWGSGGWGSWGGSWGGCGGCGYGGYGYGGWGGGRWGGYDGGGWSYGSGGCGCCGDSSVSYGSCGSCDGVSLGGYGGEVASGYASNSRSMQFVPAGVNASSDNAAPAATKLTLHVPAEAKVTLAGVTTKQTGEVRQFSTSQLAAGQAWQNYTVHVELVRDGKTLTQDRQITLTGGTAQELSIDFGSSQLAGM
jgi:uncharacterized protein (TIGR03000 family)